MPIRPARTLIALAALAAAPAAAAIDVADAAALYQRNCAACHGENGNGDSRAKASLAKEPRDFTAADARRKLPREFMVAIIRDGKHEAPMVGRKSRLTEEQMEAIVDFIRAAYMPPEPGSRAARGREIYQARCAACHGDRGQGASHGAATVPGLSRTRARPDLTREDMIAAVAAEKHGSLRAGLSKDLSAEDREAVIDYVRSTFIEGRR